MITSAAGAIKCWINASKVLTHGFIMCKQHIGARVVLCTYSASSLLSPWLGLGGAQLVRPGLKWRAASCAKIAKPHPSQWAEMCVCSVLEGLFLIR